MVPSRSTHHVSLRALRLCWVAFLPVLVAAGPEAPAFAGQGTTAAENGYSYYYFKEPRGLNLDTNRIAVLRAPDKRGAASAVPDLSPYGLDAATVEPMAVHGWSFVTTTASVRTNTAIKRVVSQIARAEPVDFVSPVFVDDEGGPIVVTPDILVGFDRTLDPARAEAILAEADIGETLDRDWANMTRAYRLKSASRDGFEVLEAANRLAQRPEVMFAEPDLMVTAHLELFPNDTYFQYLWGLHNDGTFPIYCGAVNDFDMDAPEAWDITIGDPSIIVAILDDGIQQDHPDLNLYMPGFDATGQGGGGEPVNECDNHGTAVAGCVSGRFNNDLGIVGIAPGVKSASARMIVSSLACDGTGTITASWVVDALAWAESIGARITNSSWHRSAASAITQKYADTRANGMIHFGAAGNNASSTIVYPASLPTVNAVAALDPCGNRAVFSNYGEGLAFSAPGHYGISTDRTGTDGYNDGIDDGGCLPSGIPGCNSDGDCGPGETCFLVSLDYALVAGTSLASPYAAGVAALALSVRPYLTVDEIESVLQQSSVDLGDAGYDTDYGWGFVNAANALAGAIATAVEPAQPFGPVGFALRGNRPNPFAARTSIEYNLARESMVQLRIIDVAGRVVRAMQAHSETAGPHEFMWDGTDATGSRVAAGAYLIELRVNDVSQTRRAVLLH